MSSILSQLSIWRNMGQFVDMTEGFRSQPGQRGSLRRFEVVTQAVVCGLDIANTGFSLYHQKFVPYKILELAARILRLVLVGVSLARGEMSARAAYFEITKEVANIGRLGLEIGIGVYSPQMLVALTAFDVGLRVQSWLTQFVPVSNRA